METLRNFDDLLVAALVIEEKGAEFYKKAAELAKDSLAQQLLLDLVQWENDHYTKFNKMRESLTIEEKSASGLGEGLDVESIVASGAIKLTRDPAGLLKGDEKPEEMLDVAISLERDTIIFYMFLRGLVPVVDRKKEIDRIVLEEIGHVQQLGVMRKRVMDG
jgi:rubrerythrin